MIANANAEPTRAVAEGELEPGRVVDTVLRLLASERVPIAISSISRAQESAARLLQDLGVEPAPTSPKRAYWWGVSDAIVDRYNVPDDPGQLGVRP